jgi:hypothetical protein
MQTRSSAALALVLVLAALAAACKSDPGKKHPGFERAPAPSGSALSATACTPGADQTCNDNPLISKIHGTCQMDGQCSCHPGFSINPATGKCK